MFISLLYAVMVFIVMCLVIVDPKKNVFMIDTTLQRMGDITNALENETNTSYQRWFLESLYLDGVLISPSNLVAIVEIYIHAKASLRCDIVTFLLK